MKTYICHRGCLGIGYPPSILNVASGNVRMGVDHYECGTRCRAAVHPRDGVLQPRLGSCRELARVEECLIELEL